jgi:amino acid transporter
VPTSGGLYWWTHYYASPKTRNALSFLVGYSNTLGLIGGLCSIDYGFALMFVATIVISRDGEWEPGNGIVYIVFMCCVICHGILASTISKAMGKLQTAFVVANFILIAATIIALPIGRSSHRNDGKFIFATTGNLTTWPAGFAWFLSWLSPIWTIGGFDSCVHMSEEAANATKAVPYGILMSIGSCWIFGFIICIVIASCANPDFETLLGSVYGQPMAQIYFDAVGKKGALGLMSLLFIVQFFMGLSMLVAVSRQSWVRLFVYLHTTASMVTDSIKGLLPRRRPPLLRLLQPRALPPSHPHPCGLGLRFRRIDSRPPLPHRTSSRRSTFLPRCRRK